MDISQLRERGFNEEQIEICMLYILIALVTEAYKDFDSFKSDYDLFKLNNKNLSTKLFLAKFVREAQSKIISSPKKRKSYHIFLLVF